MFFFSLVALDQSCLLSKEFGPYETFKESPASRGLLQFDLAYIDQQTRAPLNHRFGKTSSVRCRSAMDDGKELTSGSSESSERLPSREIRIRSESVASSSSSSSNNDRWSLWYLQCDCSCHNIATYQEGDNAGDLSLFNGCCRCHYPIANLNSRLDWIGLKKRIMKYGLRNSLVTAQMPTASTAHILGNSEGMSHMPMYVWIFLKGNFLSYCFQRLNQLCQIYFVEAS